MKKKFLLIFIIFLILANHFMFVNAQPREKKEGLLGGVFDIAYDLFGGFQKTFTIDRFKGQDDKTIFLAKFVLWIFLFSVLYYAARWVFPEQKSVRVVVPTVIAIMGVILIPNNILLSIFQTYTVAGAALIWLLPFVGMWMLIHRIPGDGAGHYAARAALYVLLLYILSNITIGMSTLLGYNPEGAGGYGWLEYFNLLYVAAVIGLVHSIIKLFSSLGIGGGFGRGWGGGKGIPAGEDIEKKLAERRGAEEEGKHLIEGEEADTKQEEAATQGEEQLLQSLKDITKREITDNEFIINDLNTIKQALQQGANMYLIGQKINEMRPAEADAERIDQYIGTYAQRIDQLEKIKLKDTLQEKELEKRFEELFRKWHKDKKFKFTKVADIEKKVKYISGKTRREIKKEMGDLKKILRDKDKLIQHEKNYINHLNTAVQHIGANDTNSAIKEIDKAINEKNEQDKILKDIARLDDKIEQLEKKEMYNLRNEEAFEKYAEEYLRRAKGVTQKI